MNDDLERRFHRAMLKIYTKAKKECNYHATRFFQLLDEYRGLETARMLLRNPQIQEGLANLYELGRLDLTVEALVIDPDWKELFEPEEIEIARTRLLDLGYSSDNI
ncbi:MAG TPA: hypothetical protein VMX17_09430 [Candidatus Glassbacteria bacterium]|nr:hypothetical protein [Candidatus Glassbacteria bacterium]